MDFNFYSKHPLTLVMEHAGINKNKLAKKLGKQNAYLTMVEKGRKPLSVSAAMDIEKITGCNGAKLHLESLCAQLINNVLNEYEDIENLDIREIAKTIVKVAKKRHEYLMTEYYEMEKLRNSISYGGLRKKA